MGYLRGLFRFQSRSVRQSYGWTTLTPRSSSGVVVTEESLLGLAAYFAALRAISEDVGKLPLRIYEEIQPRGKQMRRDHPVWFLLNKRPNPNMSAISFRETLTQHALGWGGGYAEIVFESMTNTPAALWPLNPRNVEPDLDDDGEVVYRVRRDAGGERVLPSWRVLHVKGLGWDGIRGYSIAKFARESLGSALAAQEFAGTFFGRGTQVGGVLKHPNTLSDRARQALQESIEAKYAGPENAHRVMVLEEGMEFEQTSIPPEDAQMLESQQFSVEDIARWFRIPPHKLQHLLRSTFSNIESQNIEYVVDCLLPWLVRWEQEIDAKLFGTQRELEAEHLVDELLRGDMKARAESNKALFMIGALSQNDVRERENLNPIDGGDQYFVPVNMAPHDSPRTAPGGSSAAQPAGLGDEMIRENHEGLAFAALGPLATKHRHALERAAKRADGDQAAFDEARAVLLDGDFEAMQTALEPVALSLLSLVGGDDWTGRAERAVAEYVGIVGCAEVASIPEAIDEGRVAAARALAGEEVTA